MELDVNIRRSYRKKLIEVCIAFYAYELKINNRNFQLLVKTINGMSKDGIDGCVGMLAKRKKYQTKNDSKFFIMTLDSRLNLQRLIQVLAHEMIHVKQNVLGQLRHTGRSTYWLGTKVLGSKLNYFDQPWEIEAWSKEKLLSIKILKMLSMIEKNRKSGKYSKKV